MSFGGINVNMHVAAKKYAYVTSERNYHAIRSMIVSERVACRPDI